MGNDYARIDIQLAALNEQTGKLTEVVTKLTSINNAEQSNISKVASDTIQMEALTETSADMSGATGMKAAKTFRSQIQGVLRVTWDSRKNAANSYFAIYKNGVLVTNYGSESDNVYRSYTRDVEVVKNDLIQVGANVISAVAGTVWVKDFRVRYIDNPDAAGYMT